MIIAILASICTLLAGIMHLSLVHSLNNNAGILFFVGGLAQIFWVVPTIKNWGRVWDYVGIGGTIVLIVLFFLTRLPGNPITGRGLPVGGTAIYLEVFQILFIILLGILAWKRKPLKSIKKL
ncbi:MAG: hypothetical protein M3Z01_07830 [Thermoproteota archaeon]|nr:hypothetical protein [Thermoproteota archaeon]